MIETGAAEPTVALRHASFRRYLLARIFGMVGFQMQGVAVGWQVYELTHRPLDLGYVGLAQFLPSLLLALVAGDVADRFERRRLLMVCYGILACCTGALAAIASLPTPSVGLIYGVLVVVGIGRAFAGPAAQALVPNLVPTEHFPNAVAWSSSVWHVAVVAGPALGGAVYAASNSRTVYLVAALLQLVALGAIGLLPIPKVLPRTEGGSWRRLLAGIEYVWRQKVILGAISLDMFAVMLGGAVALLPVYAKDVLHTGPTGLGLLRSAPAVGATLMSLWLAFRPIERRTGLVMFAGVFVFGLATIVFGWSKRYGLSLVALTLLGAADMISVFVRSTVVQLATPDDMRGRVAAVNLAFIGVSNELGEFESGVTASLLGTELAVIVGGVGSCVVVLAWMALFPALRRIDKLDVASLRAP
ncbi:MAG: MFS transporter [Deltaproteobacteria bacterium]|nr:MFS transporter [Deltaproteobacteria bacterium]